MSGGGTPYKYFSGKGSGLVHELLAKLPGGWGEKVRGLVCLIDCGWADLDCCCWWVVVWWWWCGGVYVCVRVPLCLHVPPRQW